MFPHKIRGQNTPETVSEGSLDLNEYNSDAFDRSSLRMLVFSDQLKKHGFSEIVLALYGPKYRLFEIKSHGAIQGRRHYAFSFDFNGLKINVELYKKDLHPAKNKDIEVTNIYEIICHYLSFTRNNVETRYNIMFRVENLTLSHVANEIHKSENDYFLSQEEKKVLLLCANEYKTRSIAKIMGFSESCIHHMILRIREKLNAKNIYHAVYKALRFNLIETDDDLYYDQKKYILELPEETHTLIFLTAEGCSPQEIDTIIGINYRTIEGILQRVRCALDVETKNGMIYKLASVGYFNALWY